MIDNTSKKTIIICYGYEGADSRNANAICLYNLLSIVPNSEDFLVVTSGKGTIGINFFEEIKTINLLRKKDDSDLGIYAQTKKELYDFKIDAIEYINKVILIENFKNIVCISFPYVTLEIGQAIKRRYKEINFLVYVLDPYALNNLLRFNRILYLYRFKKEYSIFKLADKIFLTTELYELYSKNYFKTFFRKFVKLGIPMLKIQEQNMVVAAKESCRIVYAGALSKKFRDPSFMLRLFSLIKDKSDWTLHIYGADKQAIEKEYFKVLKNRLFIYDKVPRSDMPNILKEASFLLNISNLTTIQLPSKILDYIGFRKPIINFYIVENDICKKYLKNYPITISIKTDMNKENHLAEQLNDFILENKGANCSSEYIKNAYKELTTEEISINFCKEL